MIGGRRPLQGRKLGDKRVRVERHHAACFRRTGKGQLTAKGAAYLDVLDLVEPPDQPAPITIVVLSEVVARHRRDRPLYNQSAKPLKTALVGREHTVTADVPFRRSGD